MIWSGVLKGERSVRPHAARQIDEGYDEVIGGNLDPDGHAAIRIDGHLHRGEAATRPQAAAFEQESLVQKLTYNVRDGLRGQVSKPCNRRAPQRTVEPDRVQDDPPVMCPVSLGIVANRSF